MFARTGSAPCSLVVLLALLLLWGDGAGCDPRCEMFTFCSVEGNPSTGPAPIVLHAPEKASYPFICMREGGGMTSHIWIEETGEALVSPIGPPRVVPTIPISEWPPSGVPAVPAFESDYFDVFGIPLSSEYYDTAGNAASIVPFKIQGVGRRQSLGNQELLINNLCVSIPIRVITRLDESGSAIETRQLSGFGSSCISFETKAPELVANLFWSKGPSPNVLEVDLVLTNAKKAPLQKAGMQMGNPTRCVGCQTLYVPSISPGTYRVRFTLNINVPKFVVRDVIASTSHECPGEWGRRRTAVLKQLTLGDVTFVKTILQVTLRGKLILDREKRFRLRGTRGISGFFPGKIRVR